MLLWVNSYGKIEGIERKKLLEQMSLLEKEICIKCDKGGEVLACADSCCPIAVHVRCMGCPARFDDLGKFYCPYCVYRQTIARFHQAKEHVLSKKQALDNFIGNEMIDNVRELPSIVRKSARERVVCHYQKRRVMFQNAILINEVAGQQIYSDPGVDCSSKPSGHTSSKVTSTDFRVLEAGSSVKVNDPQKVGEPQLEKCVEDHHQDGHLNFSVAEDGKLGNELVLEEKERNSPEIVGKETIEVDQTTATVMKADPSLQKNLHGKRRAVTGDLTCGESKRVSKQRECGKQVNKVKDEHMLTDSLRRLTRTSVSLLENGNAVGKLVQVKQRSMLPDVLPNGKRRRVLWRREEEEMIEKGVKTFSSTVNKNIPWRQILELGHHVFDHTRTPTDLKDKWKQICSKYGGRVWPEFFCRTW